MSSGFRWELLPQYIRQKNDRGRDLWSTSGLYLHVQTHMSTYTHAQHIYTHEKLVEKCQQNDVPITNGNKMSTARFQCLSLVQGECILRVGHPTENTPFSGDFLWLCASHLPLAISNNMNHGSLKEWFKRKSQGWRDGSEVKSIGCFSRGSRFDYQLQDSSQPSVTPVPRNLASLGIRYV